MRKIAIFIISLLLLKSCLVPSAPVYKEYIKNGQSLGNIRDLDIDIKSLYLRNTSKDNYDIVSLLRIKNVSKKEINIENYDFKITSKKGINFEINSISKESCSNKISFENNSTLLFEDKKINLVLLPDKSTCLFVIHTVQKADNDSSIGNIYELNYSVTYNNDTKKYVFNAKL